MKITRTRLDQLLREEISNAMGRLLSVQKAAGKSVSEISDRDYYGSGGREGYETEQIEGAIGELEELLNKISGYYDDVDPASIDMDAVTSVLRDVIYKLEQI